MFSVASFCFNADHQWISLSENGLKEKNYDLKKEKNNDQHGN